MNSKKIICLLLCAVAMVACSNENASNEISESHDNYIAEETVAFIRVNEIRPFLLNEK